MAMSAVMVPGAVGVLTTRSVAVGVVAALSAQGHVVVVHSSAVGAPALRLMAYPVVVCSAAAGTVTARYVTGPVLRASRGETACWMRVSGAHLGASRAAAHLGCAATECSAAMHVTLADPAAEQSMAMSAVMVPGAVGVPTTRLVAVGVVAALFGPWARGGGVLVGCGLAGAVLVGWRTRWLAGRQCTRRRARRRRTWRWFAQRRVRCVACDGNLIGGDNDGVRGAAAGCSGAFSGGMCGIGVNTGAHGCDGTHGCGGIFGGLDGGARGLCGAGVRGCSAVGAGAHGDGTRSGSRRGGGMLCKVACAGDVLDGGVQNGDVLGAGPVPVQCALAVVPGVLVRCALAVEPHPEALHDGKLRCAALDGGALASVPGDCALLSDGLESL